jgi:hypothetical protein
MNAVAAHRGLAIAFGLCAAAILLLLGSHPGGGGATLTDILKQEAQNQLLDGVVHGGMVLVLTALIVCFVLLARLLSQGKVRASAGLVAFCVGSGALMASMILDGFVTPAIAARFAGSELPADLAVARTSLILLGTIIRFLMAMGLLLQAVATLAFSSIIVTGSGLRRITGVFGVAAALSIIGATLAVPASMAGHVMLGCFLLLAIWYLGLTLVLFNGRSWG